MFFFGLLHIDQINNLINERITIKACNECTDFLISNQRRKKKERGLAARTYSSVINWSEDNTRSGWSPWMNLLYMLRYIITYNTYVLIFHAMWKISFHFITLRMIIYFELLVRVYWKYLHILNLLIYISKLIKSSLKQNSIISSFIVY